MVKKLIGDWKKDLGGELQDWEVRETGEVAVGTLTHGRAESEELSSLGLQFNLRKIFTCFAHYCRPSVTTDRKKSCI